MENEYTVESVLDKLQFTYLCGQNVRKYIDDLETALKENKPVIAYEKLHQLKGMFEFVHHFTFVVADANKVKLHLVSYKECP